MGKRIEEKYSVPWRATWMFAAIPFALALPMPLVTWTAGRGFTEGLELAAMVIGSVLFMMGFVWMLSKDEKTTWFLTDDGLLRIHTSRPRTMITWDKIQKMKLTGFGLMILWNEPDNDKKKEIVYDERRSFLGIGEQEAKELISIWKEIKAVASKSQETGQLKTSHKTYRVRSSDAGRNAGKLVVLGFIGLLFFATTILKRDWLMAALSVLFTATAFGLSYFLMHPLGSRWKSLMNWSLVSLLMLIGFLIYLAEHKAGLFKK